MSDPKFVVKKETWNKFTPDEKLEIIYDTTISARDSNIELTKKVNELINKVPTPCDKLEARIKTLERWKIGRTIITAFGSILGGFGGSHIPK